MRVLFKIQILIVLLILTACSKEGGITSKVEAKANDNIENNSEETGISKTKKPVEVVGVQKGDLDLVLNENGTLEVEKEIIVKSQAPGTIARLFFKEGDFVKKNAVLIKLDDYAIKQRIERAQASLIGAESRYHYAVAVAEKQVQTDMINANEILKMTEAKLDLLKAGVRAEEIKQIKAQIVSAEAKLENDRLEYDRVKKLFDQSLATKQMLDNIETQVKISTSLVEQAKQQLEIAQKGSREESIKAAEAEVRQAKANYEMAKALYDARSWEKDTRSGEALTNDAVAALNLVKRELEDTEIKAQASGTIIENKLTEGELVSPFEPLMKIMNLNHLFLKVQIPETKLSYVKKNQETKITMDAYPEDIFSGKISKIGDIVDVKTRTVEVEIYVPNKSGKLKPGMFARVSIVLKKQTDVLKLPKTALVHEKDKVSVFIVNNGIARKQNIIIGIISADTVEVISGIKEEDQVVSSGLNDLSDGDLVNIIN